MRRNCLLALCTFLTVAAIGTAASGAPPAVKTIKKPPPPDYFPVRWKYSWQYQTTTADGKKTTFSMKDIHDDKQEDGSIWHQLQIETSPTQKFSDWYSKADGLVLDNHIEYSAAMKADFIPPKQTLKHPLENGDNWQWAGTGMMKTPSTESFTVSGPEEVIVPAGKFKAMKVVSQVNSMGAKATKVYWYGPYVGLVKSTTESGPVKSTTELVSYDFPKLQPGELEAEINRPR
ncbi:hypothetical protein BH11CYA1_BH11CYA1_33970 [soil metagenome]